MLDDKMIDVYCSSIYNKKELSGEKVCGCYYCLSIFSASEIEEWVDDGQTAICPHCGIDSVISDTPNRPINKRLLKKMKRVFFAYSCRK